MSAKDGSIHSYLGPNGVGHCHNGHVLWVDDETLMAGNQHPGLFDLQGSVLNPKTDHIQSAFCGRPPREPLGRTGGRGNGAWCNSRHRLMDRDRWVRGSPGIE